MQQMQRMQRMQRMRRRAAADVGDWWIRSRPAMLQNPANLNLSLRAYFYDCDRVDLIRTQNTSRLSQVPFSMSVYHRSLDLLP